jgi:translation initiation factor IF-2
LADTKRVHTLAKELNVPSKAIIDKCQAEGIDTVKNHMSTLSAGLAATIREWFSEGRHDTALETTQRVDLQKVRVRPRRKKAGAAEEPPESHETETESATATATLEAPPAVVIEAPTEELPPPTRPTIVVEPAPQLVEEPPAPPPALVERARELRPVVEAPPSKVVESAPPAPPLEPLKPSVVKGPVVPAGPQNVPAAAKLQGPRVVRYEAPDYDVGPRRRPGAGVGPRVEARPPLPAGRGFPPAEPAKTTESETARRKGRVNPRRAEGRLMESGEQLAEWRDQDLQERRERLAGATGRKIHRRRATPSGAGAPAGPAGPKTKAVVHEPIRMKEFCAATGLNFMQLFKVLRDQHGILGNVNMILPTDTAQLLAMHHGMELEVVAAKTMLDELQEEFANRKRGALEARPPVVTMLGHVDHGKTSLLDAIRKTQVAAGEDGGITQHIGSYHIETGHGAVTFLDTPGHEAFTAMRARGANMTDVVVLVVAADDGIMPQTVEAIHHAQAAKVPIVVALNKIDLGDQNKLKIYGQLAEHSLNPSEWGGEVDVIPTSATTGRGITELVDHLADLSSLLELRADPTLPATGTVIESEMKPGVGAVARVLVQDGTLNIGDFAVCGNAFGKVRALVGDRGERLSSAGPAIPAEVWGLDEPPAAGDKLYVVESLQRAKEIAAQAKRVRTETGRLQSRKVKTLEEMFLQRDADEVPELNVLVKADVDGSVAALKGALAEIPSDEVRLTIRHAAVGAVNDSDILLAAACKGIIVAFRVDTSTGAKRLAEQNGVEVRPYRVIYEVCDDIRKALSGMLAPEEKIESRAAIQVRQLFRITKVGMVAGCYVTSGTVERGHLAKVVRDGVVVREGCRFSSLRHVKDDVREVRAGMECGLRLEGFEDIHVGDVIETYEIMKIARTL